MRLKAIRWGALACVSMLAVYGSASAATIAESFTSPTLDSSWGVYGSPPFSVSTGPSGLTIQYSSTTAVPAGVSGGVYSNFNFDGNFTAQVTQTASGIPVVTSGTFVNGVFLAGPASGRGAIGPFNLNTGPTVQGAVFNNDVYIGGQNFNLSSQTNVLTIQRVGDTIFESVAPLGSSTSTSIYSASGAAFLGSSSINLDLYVQGTDPVANASVTYSNLSVTSADPSSTLAGVVGGTAADPKALGANNIDEITGSIGDGAPESFFKFHWNGGAFNSVANLVGADPKSSFEFELLGGVDQTVTLDQGDFFIGHIQFDDLAAGDYSIGLLTGGAPDPTYFMDFATPISGAVPEPATWAMMLVGFGTLGYALRKRKQGRATADVQSA